MQIRKNGIKIISLTISLLLLGIVNIYSASNVLEHKSFPKTWQAQLDKLVNSGEVPGAVSIVSSPDWGVRVGVSGKANLEMNIPTSAEIPYWIGSISKIFTAIVVLQLEQDGLLRLDDTVSKYLSPETELKHNATTMTIRELLQMSSGLGDYISTEKMHTAMNANPLTVWTPQQLVDLSNETPVLFNPGDTMPDVYQEFIFGVTPELAPTIPKWWYVDVNYILLGMIVEKVTGHSFTDEVKNRVFTPLNMSDSLFPLTASYPDTMMHGYSKGSDLLNPQGDLKDWRDITTLHPSFAWTAGAVISTPWDLMRFVKAIFTEDTLITNGTRKKWLNFVSADIHWQNMDYGVGGLMQTHRTYGEARGHGGAISGYKGLLLHFYDDNTFFMTCINTMDTPDGEIKILDSIVPLVVEDSVSTPVPVNQSQNTAFTQQNEIKLSWQSGILYGDQYKVYIGTDSDQIDPSATDNSTLLVSTSPYTFYLAKELKENTTYYWRVDSVITSKQQTIEGPVWSFKTGKYNPMKVNQWNTY